MAQKEQKPTFLIRMSEVGIEKIYILGKTDADKEAALQVLARVSLQLQLLESALKGA